MDNTRHRCGGSGEAGQDGGDTSLFLHGLDLHHHLSVARQSATGDSDDQHAGFVADSPPEVFLSAGAGRTSATTYYAPATVLNLAGNLTNFGNYVVHLYADGLPNVSVFPALVGNRANVVTLSGYLVAK